MNNFSSFFADWHLSQMLDDVFARFPLPDADASQCTIQAWLDSIQGEFGLTISLAALFAWELSVGYWPDGIFDANMFLAFPPCCGSPVEFRTQINYSRMNYMAPPVRLREVGEKPFCPICFEDNVETEAKPLLRVCSLTLGVECPTEYFVQATPFPLVRGHFIAIQNAHEPMRIERRTLDELLHFVEMVPSFTACSNSDVVNAGVSILGHHHYQVFARRWELPVMQALPLTACEATVGGGQVCISMLDYPLATVKFIASRNDRQVLLDAAAVAVERWKAKAPGQNTCNLTVRLMPDDTFEVYLFLRNPAHLTPPDLLRIKSEGVGVVEAAGEGIYPPPADDAGVEEIRANGRSIITRILGGLNPVSDDCRSDVFRALICD